ncbi:MAG TPA: response regulator [Gaiellaceae bacterium]|jgi:response regulator of citrate/malate metabolism|nr:response regulator [Gaiellaceae bacterium]
MIRTLVVDDDVMTASIHRSYVERVPGFEVVGEAHSGAGALEQAQALRPGLLLLDIYLPDMSGLDVLRALREPGRPHVDVIAVTAAKDVSTLRTAIHGGVIHYLVKPFFFDTLRERLEGYAALHGRLERLREPDQQDIDHVFSLLRTQGRHALPKGISAPTLERVVETVRDADEELTAAAVAERTGTSRGTARRYLEYLALTGAIELALRYGTTGRPEHLYRWAERVPVDG